MKIAHFASQMKYSALFVYPRKISIIPLSTGYILSTVKSFSLNFNASDTVSKKERRPRFKPQAPIFIIYLKFSLFDTAPLCVLFA